MTTPDPAAQIAELKKFCKLLAVVCALSVIAIGYLLTTSGWHEKRILDMSNLASRSDFMDLEQKVTASKKDLDALVDRVTTAEGSAEQLGTRVSSLVDKMEKENFVRKYENGGSIEIGDFGYGPTLKIVGSGGKSSLHQFTTSEGNPVILMRDKDGKIRLQMSSTGEGSRSGQYCFFAFLPGESSTSRLLCDQP